MKYQARNNYLINWPEYPLLRVSICFLLGIVVSDFNDVSMDLCLNLLFGIFILYALVSLAFRQTLNVIKLLSLFLLILAFVMGMVRCELEKTSNSNFHYLKFNTEENFIIGRISSELKKKKRYSSTVEVKEINSHRCRGNLLLYFNENDTILYKKGDVITFSGKIHELESNNNPHAFDYKSHLKYKGVDAQMFLKEHAHFRISHETSNLVEELANRMRLWALSVFERRLKNEDQLAIATAMVLGHRAHLSDELYNSFSETGAVHVLAVSGLHVGIICMIFIVIFNRFNRDDLFFKLIKLFTLLTVVWMYAMVTGASPAVLRASVMFSFILVGRMWFKGANIYNTLAFSALILLTYNPYLLFQLSFQFSYLALTSILFFQAKIERLYDTKHWITNKIWQLTSVSMAAQILVFPISIYYFHEFPTYFILSGVAAVFLATFILGTGLFLLCFDAIPFAGDLIAFGYSTLLDFFLNIILGIQSLPNNKLEGIYLSGLSMVLLYILVGSIMFFMSLRPVSYKDIIHKKLKRKWAVKLISAMCVILLLFNNLLFSYRTKNHQELIVYDVSKKTIIDIFLNNKLYNYQSENINESSVNFTCDGYRIYRGNLELVDLNKLSEDSNMGLNFDGNGGLIFKNKRLILMDRLKLSSPFLCESDVVFVINNTGVLPYDFLTMHSTSLVVLDNSLTYRVKNHWRKECKKRGIPVHDVRKDGVFRI